MTVPFPVMFTSPYVPQARELFAQFTTDVPNSRKALMNDVFKALIASGAYAKLDLLQVYAAPTQQIALLNWVSSQYVGSTVNSPVFTVDRGFAFDGASSYISTGFNPVTATGSKYTQNDASQGIWAYDVTPAGRAGATNNRVGWDVNPQTYSRANDATTTGNAVGTDARLFAWSRSASGSYVQRVNGTDLATVSVASTSISNAVLTVGRIGGLSTYGAGGARLYYAGAALSAAQSLAVYNAFSTYLTAIGAL